MIHPIDHVKWIAADDLEQNNWNPNIVYGPELALLERSILQQGWVHPILINKDYLIIDGFHRVTLVRTPGPIRILTMGMVPCSILDISRPEAMMLTVRINRAKGSHIALKMHELVTELVTQHGMSEKAIASGIGATADEVALLLRENVFANMDIKNHKYSTAWVPK